VKYTIIDRKQRNHSCRYLSYQMGEKSFRLPMIKVRLEAKEKVSTTALIDSGATTSFLPYDLAIEILGLAVEKEDVEVIGAGSKFFCDIVKLPKLTVFKGVNPLCEFTDGLFHVPKPPTEIPYAVLGRDTIFQIYQIVFREPDERFILRKL